LLYDLVVHRNIKLIKGKRTNLDAKAFNGGDMNLTNESYIITISGKNSIEFYYRDKRGWYKVSTRGRKFPATAEQILNHVLPAVAGIKPNVSIKVEHYEDPGKRVLVSPRGVETI
jgi:hypothetical protein